MNILEVYPSFYLRKGGVQRHIYDVCRESISRGHNPTVLTWGTTTQKTEVIDGITVKRVYVPQPLIILRYPMLVYLSLYMWYLIKKNRINVIHAHDYLPAESAALAGLLSNTPVVATFHLPVRSTTYNPPSYLLPAFFFEKLFKKIFNQRVATVICVSKLTYNDAAKAGIPKNKLKIIYNWPTFSANVESNQVNSFNCESKKPYVLAVGRLLEKQKRFSLLLQAFSYLTKKGFVLNLVIVGDGPDAKTYRNYVETHCLAERVQFIGNASDEELICLYRNCELLAVSSAMEGMSLVLLEAMYFGAPIVATSFEGAEEVITNGVNGLLVAHDAYNLSAGIEKMLNDPPLRQAFTMKSKQTVEKTFSPKNLTSTLTILEKLAD